MARGGVPDQRPKTLPAFATSNHQVRPRSELFVRCLPACVARALQRNRLEGGIKERQGLHLEGRQLASGCLVEAGLVQVEQGPVGVAPLQPQVETHHRDGSEVRGVGTLRVADGQLDDSVQVLAECQRVRSRGLQGGEVQRVLPCTGCRHFQRHRVATGFGPAWILGRVTASYFQRRAFRSNNLDASACQLLRGQNGAGRQLLSMWAEECDVFTGEGQRQLRCAHQVVPAVPLQRDNHLARRRAALGNQLQAMVAALVAADGPHAGRRHDLRLDIAKPPQPHLPTSRIGRRADLQGSIFRQDAQLNGTVHDALLGILHRTKPKNGIGRRHALPSRPRQVRLPLQVLLRDRILQLPVLPLAQGWRTKEHGRPPSVEAVPFAVQLVLGARPVEQADRLDGSQRAVRCQEADSSTYSPQAAGPGAKDVHDRRVVVPTRDLGVRGGGHQCPRLVKLDRSRARARAWAATDLPQRLFGVPRKNPREVSQTGVGGLAQAPRYQLPRLLGALHMDSRHLEPALASFWKRHGHFLALAGVQQGVADRRVP